MTERKLIIYEDVSKEVVTALESYIEHIDEDCTRSGCMCDLRGETCSQPIKTILHRFESGLCLYEKEKEEKKETLSVNINHLEEAFKSDLHEFKSGKTYPLSKLMDALGFFSRSRKAQTSTEG